MHTTTIAALGWLAGVLQGNAVQSAEPTLARDAVVQAAIERVLVAPSEVEQRRALDELRTVGDARLVPQLFLRSKEATDTRDAMFLGFALRALAIPPEHVVRALVPLLESSDAKLRADVGGVLGEYEDRSLDRGANFSVYAPYLAAGAPLGLARHLFEVDPDAALLAFARAELRDPAELRALVFAEHQVADARWKLRYGFAKPEELARAAPDAERELTGLARHPLWWARLYALRVASDEPALRAAVPLEALRKDEHPLVREAAPLEPR